MKTLLVVGFIAICVIAHDSEEKGSEKSAESKSSSEVKSSELKSSELKSTAHPGAVGGHSLECKKNETSGCHPCGPEKSCHPTAETHPIPCTTDCKPACVCEEGHVKGPHGNCILEVDCPKP